MLDYLTSSCAVSSEIGGKFMKKVESWKIIKFTENKREFRNLAFETNTDDTIEMDVPKTAEINTCAANRCTMEIDDLVINCHECKLLTHFECTKLLVYRLFIYKMGK